MADCGDMWDDLDDDLLLGIDAGGSSTGELCEKELNDDTLGDGDSKKRKTGTEGCELTATQSEKKRSDQRSPLERYRGGYLWVTDLCKQIWCEQQMFYHLTMPRVIVEESPIVTVGQNLHLARELAVQDVVKIAVKTSEDIFAVKVLNLLGAVKGFLSGVPVRREILIFGSPFGQDIFIMGLIDEIRCDPETFELEILEFKTRSTKSLPSKAQKNAHNLQVMLYKRLFDDLVQGKLTKELIAKNMRLDLSVKFSTDIQKEVNGGGLECKDLDGLMQALFDTMQCMTCIGGILIEYCYQGDQSTIGLEQVEYSEIWFKSIFDDFCDYWKGKREICGVDIEDAWKCQRCAFAEVCDWRKKRAEECASKNKKTK
ncbi:exonuclease V-like [Lineus longissimus]|uniref:exonuclease V-like n=1 Tax=Lineus longissimus TaxID=88925 RepID=UPI002B4D8002